MISVCIATYNGGKYLNDQLLSIEKQLSSEDEIIISDDGSTDNTLDIINTHSLSFKGIRVFKNSFHNHILNFEFALSQAKGDYIFLSDQDDVWLDNKVETFMEFLKTNDLVCSNCIITDENLHPDGREFMLQDASKLNGFFKNLYHNHYLGCCMAFNKSIRDKALPFPKNLITHDTWIGLVSEIWGHPIFINDKLIYFRRHGHNTSNTLNKSNLSIKKMISYRLTLIKGILERIF